MLAAGVRAAVIIAYNPERWASSATLCAEHSYLRRVVGLHPNDALLWSDDLRAELERELAKGDALAIGETGLDFYRDGASAEMQVNAFQAQLEIARDVSLPVVIHQRDAEQEVIDMLRPFAPLRGVLHCFSGGPEFASACVDMGLHLGIGGVATYPKSSSVRSAVASAPRDRLILETDAPFLSPQSSRGKRNEPARVAEVAAYLADLLGTSIELLAEQTTANAIDLFGQSLRDATIAGTETGAGACV
jgi:TatD DNase family protein